MSPHLSGAGPDWSSTGSRGVVTVANDRYLDWLVALLASLRATNPALPVVVIPYDRDIQRLAVVLGRLRVPLWRPGPLLAACDRIAGTLGARPQLAGTFRRLAAFDGPFETFLYLDADTVVLRDLAPIFAAVAGFGRQIVFSDISEGMSYVIGPQRNELLRGGSVEWANGVFFARNDVTAVAAFGAVAGRMTAAERALLRPELVDQAFLNWSVDRLPLAAGHLATLSPYANTWAFSELVESRLSESEHAGAAREASGCAPGSVAWLLHWAGLPQPDPAMPHGQRWWRLHAVGALAVAAAG